MNRRNILQLVIIAIWITSGFIFTENSLAKRPESMNKIVIIVDNSGSYKDRQADAINKSRALLNELCERKLHRWDPDTDIITLISLDAIPEVIWNGSLSQLETTDSKVWTERFQARIDYSNCTDVAAAFQLAVRYLDGDPRYIHKYLFVFSDLIDEPPGESISAPITRSSLPVGEFPWENLKDVSVSVFWMPKEQKFAWSREIEKQGLQSNFALYTTSESDKVIVQPPAAAAYKVTDAEREGNKKEIINKGKKAGKYMGYILLCSIGIPLALFIVFRLIKRGPKSRPSGKTMQPPRPAGVRRTGTIPPLPVNRRTAGSRPWGQQQ